ncbi:hypothetical protein [Rhizobium sp. NXC24]|uniref:hypothetical protein n=1 Tax=Rhizobium sp. NXC24 TaxID=2048897 RepID=UPI00131A5E9A|nr:hypothetical protein [Rhizobium sp. NXC24]
MSEPVEIEGQLLEISHHTIPEQPASSTSGAPIRRLRRSPSTILDPICSGIVPVSRLQTEERHMLIVFDEIRQLRTELAACIHTPS